MKTTHPEATDSSALRIQKLLLKLSLNMKVKKLIKLLSSHQNQRQNLEKFLITFSLRTFQMNGQKPMSKKLLVFSVKLPPSISKSTKTVYLHSFVTVLTNKQIANMDHRVLLRPSKKWTENKLVIKFFTSKPLLRRMSVRKNFNTRLLSIRTPRSDAIFSLRTSPLRQLRTTSEISLLSTVRLNHLNYLVKLRTRALMHSYALKLLTPQVKPSQPHFNSVIASFT